jgi:hypothetical protein
MDPRLQTSTIPTEGRALAHFATGQQLEAEGLLGHAFAAYQRAGAPLSMQRLRKAGAGSPPIARRDRQRKLPTRQS